MTPPAWGETGTAGTVDREGPIGRTAMTALVRRHRLVAFFLLTFVLSWWSWPLWAAGLAPAAHWTCGPLVAALVVAGIADGRAGYRDLGARLVRWRVGAGPWAFAIGVPLLVLAAATWLNVTIWGAPVPGLARVAWGDLALVAAIRFVNPLDGPLGEEPGWRGYALPWLQVTRTPLGAALVLGPIVALWHLPLVTTGQLAPVGLPVTVMITVVYVWLFDRARGSVLLAMVFHVAQGTISYAALGLAGADAGRMDLLTGAIWTALAVGLALDPRMRRAAPAEATAARPAARAG
jgi:membrane protease YdiL (CAAX protease family)